MATLSIRLLGPFQVALDGREVTGFATVKTRALLAYLVVEDDWPHRRESLAGLLWPDYPERSARISLRSALTNLRQVIGDADASPPYLDISRQTIRFNRGGDAWSDVATFAQHLETGLAPDEPAEKRRVSRLEEAVDLYRGPFLEGFSVADSSPFEEWALLTRERFQREAAAALQHLVENYDGCGDFQRALHYAWRQVEMDPWREAAQNQLMRLLALNGQREAALAQYQAYRRLLRTELDLQPSEQIQETFQLLLKGELRPGPPTAKRAVEREARVVGECPYRGLAAFREADAPFFFGREKFVERLVEALHERALVAVIVGPSGSGKSSAVFAGLLPLLRGTSPLLRGTSPRLRGTWLIADFRPRDQPFHALAAALLLIPEPELGVTDRLVETRKLAQALREGKVSVFDVVEGALADNEGAGRLLLLVDQLEELYTLCSDRELQRRFLETLLVAVERGRARRASPLALLVTLRADFMGQALAHRPFTDALQEGALMLGPMTRGELRAAIERPAERQGAALEDGLVERLLDDVGEEPGKLPLLEFALTLLWERLDRGWMTHAAYEEIGRVDGALARYAEGVFDKLTGHEQETARRVFLQLVQPGEGTEDTRRVATRADLGDAKASWSLVQHLADKRLVVTGRNPITGSETVEVVHEALIQRWGQLRRWMEAERAFRTWQERLRAALRAWEASDRDEGALLRGAPLVEAESWWAEREEELGAPERGYIQAGVALRERRQSERERRRRRTVLALAGGLVLALLLALLAGGQWQRAEEEVDARAAAEALAVQERQAAQTEADSRATAEALAVQERQAAQTEADSRATAEAVALEQREEALRQASVGLAGSALAELEGPAPERAVLLALAALEDYPYTPQAESALAQAVEAYKPYALLQSPGYELVDAAWSPDGERVAAVVGTLAAPYNFVLWDARTGRLLKRDRVSSWPSPPWECILRDLAWSPQGDRLVVSPQTYPPGIKSCPAPRLLDGLSRSRAELAGHAGNVNGVGWSPDGRWVLTASDDGTVKVWEVVEKGGAKDKIVERLALSGHAGSVQDAAWSPAGDRVATASSDGTARVWDVSALRQAQDDAALNPGLGQDEGTGADTGAELLTLSGHAGGLTGVAWSPDSGLLVTAGTDGTARVWRLSSGAPGGATGELLFVLSGHSDAVLDVDWSPDGERIATTSADGTSRVWEAATGKGLFKLRGAGGAGGSVAWSPSGERLLADGGLYAIRLWDLSGGALRLPGQSAWAFDAQWSPDGTRVATASPDGSARVWDAASGQELLRLEHPARLYLLDWSPDGTRIVTVQESGWLWVWDGVSGELLSDIPPAAHDAGYWSAAWSPDGSRIAAGGSPTVVVFDALTGEKITTGRGGSCHHRMPSWSPQGDRFVTGCPGESYKNTNTPARVWNAATGELQLELPSENGSSLVAEWSPDGTDIAVGYGDGSCKVWGAATGKERVTFSAHTAEIMDLNWSPDGTRVVSGDASGGVKVWDAASGAEVLSFKAPAALFNVNWSPDGDYVMAGGYIDSPLVWRAWQSTEDLIAYAKECCVTRELTVEEREQFGLPER